MGSEGISDTGPEPTRFLMRRAREAQALLVSFRKVAQKVWNRRAILKR